MTTESAVLAQTLHYKLLCNGEEVPLEDFPPMYRKIMLEFLIGQFFPGFPL
jgi:hypothetical protein